MPTRRGVLLWLSSRFTLGYGSAHQHEIKFEWNLCAWNALFPSILFLITSFILITDQINNLELCTMLYDTRRQRQKNNIFSRVFLNKILMKILKIVLTLYILVLSVLTLLTAIMKKSTPYFIELDLNKSNDLWWIIVLRNAVRKKVNQRRCYFLYLSVSNYQTLKVELY